MSDVSVALRISPPHLAVLDAWVAHLTAKRGVRVSRNDVIEDMLARVRPPEQDSPEAAVCREAQTALAAALALPQLDDPDETTITPPGPGQMCSHVWIGDGDQRTCKHCGVRWPG